MFGMTLDKLKVDGTEGDSWGQLVTGGTQGWDWQCGLSFGTSIFPIPLHQELLIPYQSDLSFCFIQGETPLHTACRHGLANLTAELLQQGANPNLQTEEALPVPKETPVPMGSADGIYLQTPLHMAIAYNHPDVVSVILEQKGRWLGMMPIIISCGK